MAALDIPGRMGSNGRGLRGISITAEHCTIPRDHVARHGIAPRPTPHRLIGTAWLHGHPHPQLAVKQQTRALGYPKQAVPRRVLSYPAACRLWITLSREFPGCHQHSAAPSSVPGRRQNDPEGPSTIHQRPAASSASMKLWPRHI